MKGGVSLVARGVAKKSRKTKKVRKKISLFLTKIKYAMFSAKHVVLTRWRWTSASVYFLTIHHPTHTHVFRYMKGASQLVISSVNVTQMTSASLTSWNENISKRWIWKQKILGWSWNTSVYCDGRPGSLVGSWNERCWMSANFGLWQFMIRCYSEVVWQ